MIPQDKPTVQYGDGVATISYACWTPSYENPSFVVVMQILSHDEENDAVMFAKCRQYMLNVMERLEQDAIESR